MKVSDVFSWKNTVKTGKTIGIEVEVESDNVLPLEVENWNVKADGSLRGNSKEYVTNGPLSTLEYKKEIKSLYEVLGNFNSSRRCGVHIHLNIRNNTIEEVFNLITVYLMLENLLIKWIGPSREGNLFCLRAKDAEYLLISLIKDKAEGMFNTTLNYDNFKYASINVSTIKKFGSLEYRALETPKDPSIILKWINIILKIRDYTLKLKNVEDAFYYYSKNGMDNFLNDVFGKTIATELMSLNGSKELLTSSIRTAQPLAYTKFDSRIKQAVNKKHSEPVNNLLINDLLNNLQNG